MVIFYNKWKKVQLNSINKNQNGLEQSKNEQKSSTLPRPNYPSPTIEL